MTIHAILDTIYLKYESAIDGPFRDDVTLYKWFFVMFL